MIRTTLISLSPKAVLAGLALLLALPLVLLAAPAGAQEPAPAPAPVAESESPSVSFGEIVDVRVVNLNVWVDGKGGNPVEGLTKDDFQLKVDGKPIEITNFRSEVNGKVRESIRAIDRPRQDDSFVPLEQLQTDPERRAYVVIYVDNTRLGAGNRRRAFNAVREVLGQLDRDDLVSVVSLSSSLVFHSDFLFDRGAVGEILDELEQSAAEPRVNEIERRQVYNLLSRGQSGGILARTKADEGELMMRIRNYATEEYQHGVQSLRALDHVIGTMAGVPGRKVLLYVSEGIPTRPGEGMHIEWVNRFGDGSSFSVGLPHVDYNSGYERDVGNFDMEPIVQKVANHANDTGVILYAIDAEGSHSGEVRSSLTEQGAKSEALTVIDENFRAPLEFATKATGGKLLRSSGKLTDQLGAMVRDFDTFYSIGFFQPDDWQPGSEHDVKVDVEGRGRRVRHQESVRVPVIGEAEARAVIAALMYQTLDNPLGIKIHPGSEVPRDDATVALPVLVEIPVGGLALVPQDTTQAVSLAFYVATKDAEGNFGAVQRIPFHLDIPNDKVDEARTQSAHYTLPVVLRKGDLQVAVGVRDDLSGVFSVVRLDVGKFTQSL